MGCGGSRADEEGVDCPLDTAIETTDIPSIDGDFSKLQGVLQSIEDLRIDFSSHRIDLFLETGSCSYKTPCLQKSINCYMWKLATETAVLI